MGAKDKKAKAADKKLRTAAKASKKTVQKEKKSSSKKKAGAHGDDDSAESDTDLDAVLASYAAAQAAHTLITESPCSAPSPRSSATLLASPSNRHELLLFGGEFFDGQFARFYNDLFVYHTRRDEWKVVKSGNAPLPRSGHAWCRGDNSGGVWLFGGEFSSPRQGVFYHYSDFWCLDPSTREWSKIEANTTRSRTKGAGGSGSGKGTFTPLSPPARSGHRMVGFKQYIVLFGGFQDTSSSTRYLNDLWVYDTGQFLWHAPVLPVAAARPEARSSFSLLPWEGGAVIMGGYSRVKSAGAGGGGQGKGGGGGKGSKQGKGAQKLDVLRPMVHTDAWFLRITPPSSTSATSASSTTNAQPIDLTTAPPTIRWERRKRPLNPPHPPRAGATMVSHRGRGVAFGGVHDVEADEEGIESEFFNGLDVWNVERNRWFGLGLKKPRTGGNMNGEERGGGRRGGKGRAKEGEDELVARLKALEAKDPQPPKDAASDADTDAGSDASDSEADENLPKPKPVQYELPHPRFRAQLAVQEDVLYIFGGTYEKGDREYTFDEMWSVDLGKLDGCKEVFRRELPEWVGEEESSSDDDSEEDEEDDEENKDDEADEEEEAKELATAKKPGKSAGEPDPESTHEPNDGKVDDEASIEAAEISTTTSEAPTTERSSNDNRPYPRPFEALRAFYARTAVDWQTLFNSSQDTTIRDRSTKATKKQAFALAEQRWWDVREEVVAEEERMEESGIGEVVDVGAAGKDGKAGAGAGAGGVGRRR